MSWLTPIGFLGLIGLIALIIIYIIKPNYQNKVVSSTFIWKLSLKLKKKQIPISKLRNILLFICQVLAITVLALILAQPVIAAEKEDEKSEKIAIIDASLSMFTNYEGETRFERAVGMVEALANDVFATERDTITVILASDNPKILVSGISFENSDILFDALNELVDPAKEDAPISYTKGDIAGAIKLAEEKTSLDPNTEVLLYTDSKYIDSGNVKIQDVKHPLEWNAAILDVRATNPENYYRLEIDFACYGGGEIGWDAQIDVTVKIFGFNGTEHTEIRDVTVTCIGGETKTLVFAHEPTALPGEEIPEDALLGEDDIPLDMLSYEKIEVTINERDCFEYDNNYELHDGYKPSLRIQYASSKPNNFFSTALLILQDTLGKRWNVEYVEVKPGQEPETTGFDFYIFEHDTIPNNLPDDGVVILANPKSIPSIAGISIVQELTVSGGQSVNLTGIENDHPLMKGVGAEKITVSKFKELKIRADEYSVLMTVQDKPVVVAKNDHDQKIVILGFSLNYSNLSILYDFPLLMYNIFEYYSPSTFTGNHVYNINDEITLTSRSEELEVLDEGENVIARTEEDKMTLKLTTPGVYTVVQTPINGETQEESFFVRTPTDECNINEEIDYLSGPYFAEAEEKADLDLLIYFALALVALLFVEWWLQSREQF